MTLEDAYAAVEVRCCNGQIISNSRFQEFLTTYERSVHLCAGNSYWFNQRRGKQWQEREFAKPLPRMRLETLERIAQSLQMDATGTREQLCQRLSNKPIGESPSCHTHPLCVALSYITCSYIEFIFRLFMSCSLSLAALVHVLRCLAVQPSVQGSTVNSGSAERLHSGQTAAETSGGTS